MTNEILNYSTVFSSIASNEESRETISTNGKEMTFEAMSFSENKKIAIGLKQDSTLLFGNSKVRLGCLINQSGTNFYRFPKPIKLNEPEIIITNQEESELKDFEVMLHISKEEKESENQSFSWE